MTSFEDSILRVLKSDLIVGAAFLVSDRLVATCAHVARSAGAKVGGKVSLRSTDGKLIEAIVEPEFWRDVNAEDISILKLEGSLENIKPLVLGSSSGTKGHNFSTYGFPKEGQELFGSGEIIGQATIDGIKVLQLRSPEVTPGFSGAPIFDEITKRVVGMIAAITPPDEYQRLGTTAFAIPSEIIRDICSELQISDVCPYRSLDVFNEEDAPFFFGRERVVQKMIDSLKHELRFLAVLGPSGSGKSSVVRAGLIPALKQGKVPGSDKWGVITIRPANQPFEQLDSAGLSKSQDGLEEAVRVWLDNHSEKTRLILIIDQFEEALVSTPEDIRQRFIQQLAHLLNASIAITIALTLRDDFYSRFLQDATFLAAWLEKGLVNIPSALDEDELRAIVVGPANAIGLTFEEGLMDFILDDASEADRTKGLARSTILPLLEFTLAQLWEKRQDGLLSHEIYRIIGKVSGSITQWANQVYDSLEENERNITRRILCDLVYPADTEQGLLDSRWPRSVLELVRLGENQVYQIIGKLVQARLLTTSRDERTGEEMVEIIHEALLREWYLLRRWVDEDRNLLRLRNSVSDAALEWKRAGRDESFLTHRGRRLEDIISITVGPRFTFTGVEQDYINACSLLNEREQAFYNETVAIKDQLSARTALAWTGMLSSSWLHLMSNKATAIIENVRLARVELENRPIRKTKLGEKLDSIQQLATQISNSRVTPPLSSEGGIEPVGLDEIIFEKLQQLRQRREFKSVKLIFEANAKDKVVRLGREWFRRVIDILIDNALDATAKKKNPLITVTTQYQGNMVEVLVADNGLGIEPAIAKRLFSSGISKESSEKGVGMGLLLAKAIIETYNGTISLKYTSLNGTCMSIILPIWDSE